MARTAPHMRPVWTPPKLPAKPGLRNGDQNRRNAPRHGAADVGQPTDRSMRSPRCMKATWAAKSMAEQLLRRWSRRCSKAFTVGNALLQLLGAGAKPSRKSAAPCRWKKTNRIKLKRRTPNVQFRIAFGVALLS